MKIAMGERLFSTDLLRVISSDCDPSVPFAKLVRGSRDRVTTLATGKALFFWGWLHAVNADRGGSII